LGVVEEGVRLVLFDDLAAVHEITRLATVRAKPISWVTQIMVIPDSASPTMTSSTSLIISGSRAEVGAAKSMTFGFMQS
jgi:hypothetical protein